MKQHTQLGQLLVLQGLINQQQLNQALDEQRVSHKRLGLILIESGWLDEERLQQEIARHSGMIYIDLQRLPAGHRLSTLIPERQARSIHAVAIERDQQAMLIGLSDPTDITVQDRLAAQMTSAVEFAVVRKSQVLAAIEQLYPGHDALNQLAGVLNEQLSDSLYDLSTLAASASGDDAPVMQLLQSILDQAVTAKASDVHIEPDEQLLRVRMRIDGQLHEQIFEQKRIGKAMIVRLKLLAGMNISEKRLPQDGRASLKVANHLLDLRIATLPTLHGESLVMRILDQSLQRHSLAQLGLDPSMQARLQALLAQPHGLILVTGPTGSGKTTTLYACLNDLNQSSRKIIAIEDPIEYRLSRVNQIQTNPQLGLDFPQVLRSALRHDPDVILVGEMRDQETAGMGVRAALTGHLVLSSLHTNDAISSVLRLTDMGVEPWLTAGALRAIIAQRLVRKLCPECKQPHPLARAQLPQLGRSLTNETMLPFFRAQGCKACQHTGYQGRTGVYELLIMSDDLLQSLRQQDFHQFAQQARQQPGFSPLAAQGLALARRGDIDLHELLRLMPESDPFPSAQAV